MISKFIAHLLVLMSMLTSILGYAHDADKAYFEIQEETGNVVVFAGFPWSIRRVLDNIKTENNNNQDLQDKLFTYVKENLILEKKNGARLPIIAIQLSKNRNEAHHGSINYKITFEGNQLFRVTNTLMCDYYKDQLNYHTLFDLPDSKITNIENPSFIIQERSFKIELIYYVVALLILLFFVYRIIKKSTL